MRVQDPPWEGTLMFGTLVIFPLGILIGYLWRDRISKARAARYWAERKSQRSAVTLPQRPISCARRDDAQ
jgi:hypothetical protein